MKAMVLERAGTPLRACDLPAPHPGPGQLLVRVGACGVCRTDLHIVGGDLAEPVLPLVPGHEIVGRVERLGAGVSGFNQGDRVGIPWLGRTCGTCRYCLAGRENLCDSPGFTGYQIDGGYAELACAEATFCLPVVGDYSDAEAAPLLCAGLIGHRSLGTRGARCSLSPVRATGQRRISRCRSAAHGPGRRARRHPSRSTPQSFSHRSALLCRPRCAPCARAARWSSAVST
jgi:D-arabinose 1-dehydrogenase-like Zn-dependent alcohol dehydrogenase